MAEGFESSGSDGGIRWKAPPPPDVHQQELDFPVQSHVTGWNRALQREFVLETRETLLRGTSPRAVCIPFDNPPVPVHSFVFHDAGYTGERFAAACPQQTPHPQRQGEASQPTTGLHLTGRTRIRPPKDLIKLEDRLKYLLQPSLEMILSERSLEFPFVPFPYQMEGIAFLYAREAAVLADEMGLGKTMQAITAIRLLLCSGEVRNVLLVCPKPLVSNWQREFAQWAPELPVAIIEGDQNRRCWQWRLEDVPVKIANYELILRDRDMFEAADPSGPGPLKFDLAVLDEAQRIKNRRSTTSQVARSIVRGRSWALTGTPVENCAEDLVGIFEFLVPGHLSPEMKPSRMGRCAGDYILRRTKDKVLTELPPKMFRDAAIELSPEQRETYRLAEDDGVLRLSEMGEGATIQHVFELILRLKQICNFDPATGASAKFERLEADLEEVAASGRKALVFSQWVSTLRRLSGQLERFGPLEYHGKIAPKLRNGIIEQFRNSPDKHVLLISYGAGGVGLNLQFCEYVFLFDRWWNPAIEDQAVNRAHRIGAAGPVTVTRFLASDTIEERINLVLEEKRELFETILSGSDRPQNKLGLTQQEIFGLFDLRSPSGPIHYAA
ncbi:MAG: DEAD/DEAH box helicase [Planctomycetaceae bacterium]|nr:DEAD/DEAH box helicase [Planctomycetaceae bacterium]